MLVAPGSDGPAGSLDIIRVAACRTTIKGNEGRDFLYAEVKFRRGSSDPWIRPECSTYQATIDGGPDSDLIQGSPGDDRLTGGSGNDNITGMNGDDRLIGGPGNDGVHGKKGRDVCQGEWVRDCEKRL